MFLFTNHKNKYFTVQVVANYTMGHVSSEQDKSVI